VDAARVPEVLAAGAAGVAAIRSWLVGDDAAAAVRALLVVPVVPDPE
jgi:thiamine-phosphate pyrophosphorylase